MKISYPQCFNEDEEDREEMMSWDEASDEHGLRNFEDMLPKTKRNALARRLAAFSSGVNQLLFQMEFLLTWMHFVPLRQKVKFQ